MEERGHDLTFCPRTNRLVYRVVINGLSSRPEFNGTKATAVSFDESKGRYNVEIPGPRGGSVMALKPENITADPH